VGTIISRAAKLQIASLPRFELEPRDVSIRISDTARFNCLVLVRILQQQPLTTPLERTQMLINENDAYVNCDRLNWQLPSRVFLVSLGSYFGLRSPISGKETRETKRMALTVDWLTGPRLKRLTSRTVKPSLHQYKVFIFVRALSNDGPSQSCNDDGNNDKKVLTMLSDQDMPLPEKSRAHLFSTFYNDWRNIKWEVTRILKTLILQSSWKGLKNRAALALVSARNVSDCNCWIE
jgi:hypothetical protein